MQLTDLLALSHVPRWSIVAHSRPQSVADHSFRVAVIYLELCWRLKIPPELWSLTYAIIHDGAEARTGDIPATFKGRVNGDIAEATAEVAPWVPNQYTVPQPHRELIKVADLIEAYAFCAMYGQGAHANRCANRMYDELLIRIAGTDHEKIVLDTINDIIVERER